MEIVALNERLRDDFSSLLKLLRPPHAVSVIASLQSSAAMPRKSSTDLYAQHCRLMLWRLNSYQYGSASAFLLDLEQLERVSDSEEQKQRVKTLKDQLAVSEGARQSDESVGTAEYMSGGVKVTICTSSGVPGLQEVRSIGSEESADKTWHCNVSMGDQSVTIGTYDSQEKALEGYQEQCSLKAKSFPTLMKLAAGVEADQREEDKRILKEAVAQCHPRLTSLKASALANSAALAAANTSGPLRALQRSDSKRLLAAASSSPVASPVPSEVAASPPRHALRSASSSAKRQKVETASNSEASIDGRSYLRLRRLIQRRLCRHLKGQEVCVLSNPNKLNEAKWRPTGRLEAGKVYSFRRKKQMTFADYVRDELGRAESACAHMFLVQERANIDDHLKVCDAFSDKERDPPAVRSHVQTATSKTRKSSRRAP
ncbi:hypothetical protein PHYBOEH_009396 [Phytophthora boehmeriae]|uniref:Uncharacterized protein n=1 Tax=Phytophthora boehmeriae TaxID=109152 RepID=A0A8T1X6Q2_9STRA|nr:hypothetical protein PHYBOEH_009396 [Phytophthora boehmeriae]